MCKISILFSSKIEWTEYISSFFIKHWAFVIRYSKVAETDIWQNKYNIINRIPYEDLADFRDNIRKLFEKDDVNFLLICNKEWFSVE